MLRRHNMRGPWCHVGSLINKADQAPDVLADLCDPDFERNHPSLPQAFGTVICWAVLEHVKQPHVAAANIGRIGYHGYPGHYFNISFDGLKLIFPDLEWKQHWYQATSHTVGLETR
jgi:hypothetical protein